MYKKVCLPLNQFRKAEKIEDSKDENSDKSAILFDVEKGLFLSTKKFTKMMEFSLNKLLN